MSDERIERELREPGPRESAARDVRLPANIREAQLLLSEIDRRRRGPRLVHAVAFGLTAAAAAVVAIVVGASVQTGLPPGHGSATPQATPSATATVTPTPTPSQGLSVCAPSNLRTVSDHWGGTPGGYGTTIHITLVSGPDCLLQGHPGARIVAADGSQVVASLDPKNRPDQPWIQPGDKRIMIKQGTATTVSVVWSNWCPAAPSAPQVQLRLTVDGPQLPVATTAGDVIPVPGCSGSGQPSTLSTYPFGG